ncbi:DUF4062 domain-containing protein [Acinetobacter sp. ANC 3781]
MSQEKKYQVFISSTYTDLIEARSAAINTVLESYNFPVGMELFGADNDEQWTIIKDLIDSSDFYILILGHRYGSISKEDGISFTEKEFDYAVSKGLKLICFVRNDNVATLPHERDHNIENLDKLKLFRQKVLTNRLCEFWDSVDDLKHKISHSLYKNMRKHGGTGWVRGNQISSQLAEEMAKLSEENRQLREENEFLKKTSEIRKPVLKVSLNEIANNMSIGEQAIVVKFPILADHKKFILPEKRTKNILLEQSYLLEASLASMSQLFGGKRPDEYFDAYNAEIDAVTEKQILIHNQCLQLLEQLNKGLLNLEIKIENTGTSLATNVNIEIQCPEFITIIDNNDKCNIDYFEKKFKDNKITIYTPEQRSEKSYKPSFYDPSPILFNTGLNLNNTINQEIKDYVDDNTIHITINSLLHYKRKIFSNYHLFPNAVGKDVIKIQLICGEYAHSESFEIPIIVE